MLKKSVLSGLAAFGVAAVLALATWAYGPTLTEGQPLLAFKWEGAIERKLNFRDTGASVNACFGSKKLPENVLFRASDFFSGWSCSRVGNPDEIVTLNHGSKHDERYYCRAADGYKVGHYYNVEEMSDLEFLKTWDEHPDFVAATCQSLKFGLDKLKEGKKVLFQCEAGRDRTGAVSALMAAYLLEEAGPLDDTAIDAIECDYRKSASLATEKYGRVKTFLTGLRGQGGVHSFLAKKCHW